jgi:DNA relaxase NicK
MTRIHWFAFTFFGEREEFDSFYREYLKDIFGEYHETGHGGRGYRSIAEANCGLRLYFEPVSTSERGNHCHVEIPGSACDCILPDNFRDMVAYFIYFRMTEGRSPSEMFSIKRIDFAFDIDIFTPDQWFEAICGEDVITLTKRESIRVDKSPFELRDNGEIGTTTVYLGSNDSDRMLRVYDKRGPTRVEIQLRDERAHLVGIDVLLRNPTTWHQAALSHLIQFVDFKQACEPKWWLEFTQSIQSADLLISSSRTVSLEKLDKWFNRQVAVALSVIYEVEGGEYFRALIKKAQKRDRSKYASLLELV